MQKKKKMTKVRNFRKLVVLHATFYRSLCGSIFRQTNYLNKIFYISMHNAKKLSFFASLTNIMTCLSQTYSPIRVDPTTQKVFGNMVHPRRA